jgi:hypothetical protein
MVNQYIEDIAIEKNLHIWTVDGQIIEMSPQQPPMLRLPNGLRNI